MSYLFKTRSDAALGRVGPTQFSAQHLTILTGHMTPMPVVK